MNEQIIHDRIELLAQADLVLITTDMLRPPEQQRHRVDGLQCAEIEELVRATGLQPADAIARNLESLVQEAQGTDAELWSGCWRLLFDASLYCPINESAYVRRDKGAIIGDVCGFYRAFGWEPADNGERPDHLLTELEFVAVLMVMLARADCETNAEIARDALARFTRDHLSDWIPAFANKLESATTLPVLRQLASWLREMWTALIEYHEWETDPQPVLRSDPGREPEDVYECGAADLVQLEKSKAEDSKA